MPDEPDPTEERDALAGELALGVLTGDERAAALRRAIAEPAFAAEVEDWQIRLAPLFERVAEVPPPEGVWRAIERGLAGAATAGVARWRAATAVASAIAACLAVALVLRPAPAPVAVSVDRPAPQPLLAQVAGEGGAMLVTAQYDATSGEMRVRTANLPRGERIPELWVIVGDAPPRSLGFVELNGTGVYLPSPELRQALIDGATIAITLEPRSATPHRAPTGDILGTATLTAV